MGTTCGTPNDCSIAALMKVTGQSRKAVEGYARSYGYARGQGRTARTRAHFPNAQISGGIGLVSASRRTEQATPTLKFRRS